MTALQDTPVVLVHGARQTGKTTLMHDLVNQIPQAVYLTLDDPSIRHAAEMDPLGFAQQFQHTLVLDEVQRVPDLGLAIKASVDQDRKAGRFLLTGSANVLQIPKLAEALVGRMEIIPLWPFSQGELNGVVEDFVDALFAEAPLRIAPSIHASNDGMNLLDRMVRGGYPEIQTRSSPDRRRAWFTAYIDTLLQRDVRDLAQIEGLGLLSRLLSILATRVGALLNYADLSRSLQIPQTTLKRYLALLERTFMIHFLPSWSNNMGLRLTKSPKLYLGDTGLLTHLLSVEPARLTTEPGLLGPIMENFVVNELRKQATWCSAPVNMFHYRSTSGQEVDLVLDGPRGQLVGIEIKASTTLHSDDLRGLRHLAAAVGPRFLRGVLIYRGATALRLEERMWAVPVQWLWNRACP